MPKILTIFTILSLTTFSCTNIPPIPTFPPAEICPPVFQLADPEKDLYLIECRCAKYDVNQSKFTGPFIKSPKKKCDRGFLFTPEYFLEHFQPSMGEIQDWYKLFKDKKVIDAPFLSR